MPDDGTATAPGAERSDSASGTRARTGHASSTRRGSTGRWWAWALGAAAALLVIYVPGFVRGIVGGGPWDRDLTNDPVGFVFNTIVWGGVAAVVPFAIGFGLGWLVSIAVDAVVGATSGGRRSLPRAGKVAIGIAFGALFASAAVLFTVDTMIKG